MQTSIAGVPGLLRDGLAEQVFLICARKILVTNALIIYATDMPYSSTAKQN